MLAHSLGGLVLQLDAIDALLDSGKTDDAHARVTAARGLAASGLDEARRAVDALRDPEASADLAGAIEDLVVTHRSLGAAASLTVSGSPGELSADAAGALRRAAQEVLSNARRHAPGCATALVLDWTVDAATLDGIDRARVECARVGVGVGRGPRTRRPSGAGRGGARHSRVGRADGAFVVSASVPRVPGPGEARS